MKTKGEVVSITMDLWAVPVPAWNRDEGQPPFNYELRDQGSQPWREGSVLLAKGIVFQTNTPTGVDLEAAAVESINARIEDERAEHAARIVVLENAKLDFMALEAPVADA